MTDASARPVLVEIGVGELIDRITILRIKAERISEPEKLANVRRELAVLEAARRGALEDTADIARLETALHEVNAALWRIEDDIRACEARGDFGAGFVDLARGVYKTNDRRAALKRQINLAAGSRIVEEKSYASHG